MNRFSSLVAATLLGATAITSVQAQDGRPEGERPQRQQRQQRREGGGEGGRGGGPGGMMRMMPLMQALDSDKDGELSTAEIANATAALKSLDKNGDGKLSQDELRPAMGPGGDRRGPGGPGGGDSAEVVGRMMANDKNGDGKLSADEMPERMRNIVTRADANKDGFATKEEITALMANQQQGGRRGPEAGEGRGGERNRE